MKAETLNFLQSLDLSKTEANIYIELIKLGHSSIAILQKNMGLPRTTLTENIERLKIKGLVYVTLEGKNKRYAAESPEYLETLLDQKQTQVRAMDRNLSALNTQAEQVILNIKELTANPQNQLDIRYYKGIDEIFHVYDLVLKHQEVRAYVNLDQTSKYFPANEQKFFNAVKAGLRLWNICNLSETSKNMISKYKQIPENSHQFKYFPKGYELDPMNYLICGDYIVIITPGEVPEAIVIKNLFLAKNAQSTFDLLWSFLI